MEVKRMSKEYEEVQVEKWVNLEDVAEHLSISQDMLRERRR